MITQYGATVKVNSRSEDPGLKRGRVTRGGRGKEAEMVLDISNWWLPRFDYLFRRVHFRNERVHAPGCPASANDLQLVSIQLVNISWLKATLAPMICPRSSFLC